MRTSVSYADRNSFRVYTEYLAIKQHFTVKSYDYHKYNGKVKASFDKFSTRSDAFYFHKLSKNQQWKNILLSNIVVDPKVWVGQLVEDSGYQIFLDWKKRTDSLTYIFQSEISVLNDTFDDNFKVKNNNYPTLLTQYLQRDISLETFTLLCNLTNVYQYWEQNISDKIVAGEAITKSKKYNGFLQYDRKKFTALIKDRFF